MLIALVYILLFSYIIYKAPFFNDGLLKNKMGIRAVNVVFLTKVVAGLVLTWVYTRYYTDRQTADIFKYHDDAQVMFSSFKQGHYGDYFKMLFGISNDNPYFDATYYNKMNHWYRQYDFGTYNDNHTIIRFNALVMLFSFGSFHAITVFMCFISLAGLMAIYTTMLNYLPRKKWFTFAAVFMVPSVVFWGSGVLKEGILLFALGFLFYSVFNIFIFKKNYPVNGVLLLLSVYLLLINKTYLLVAALPALVCFVVVEKLKFPKPFLFYLGLYLLAFFGSLWVSSLFFDNYLLKTLSLKQRDFIAVAKGGVFLQNGREFARIAPNKKECLDTISESTFRIKRGSSFMYWKNENLEDTLFVNSSVDTSVYKLVWDLPYAGSTVEMHQLKPEFSSLFATFRTALFNTLARPGLFSSGSLFEKISAVENSVFLLLLILCTAFSRTGMHKNLFSLCFFISVTILLLVGYTTPVAGAIVRYKVPVWPFMMLCAVIIFDVNKIKWLADKQEKINP